MPRPNPLKIRKSQFSGPGYWRTSVFRTQSTGLSETVGGEPYRYRGSPGCPWHWQRPSRNATPRFSTGTQAWFLPPPRRAGFRRVLPRRSSFPKFRTMMRSLTRMTVRMSCSTSSTVTPRSRTARTLLTVCQVSSKFMPANGSSSSSNRGLSHAPCCGAPLCSKLGGAMGESSMAFRSEPI